MNIEERLLLLLSLFRRQAHYVYQDKINKELGGNLNSFSIEAMLNL